MKVKFKLISATKIRKLEHVPSQIIAFYFMFLFYFFAADSFAKQKLNLDYCAVHFRFALSHSLESSKIEMMNDFCVCLLALCRTHSTSTPFISIDSHREIDMTKWKEKKSGNKLVPRKMLFEMFTTSNSFESNQM